MLGEEELGRPKDHQPEGCRMEPPREEISRLAKAIGWSVRRAFAFRKAAHINLLERRTAAKLIA